MKKVFNAANSMRTGENSMGSNIDLMNKCHTIGGNVFLRQGCGVIFSEKCILKKTIPYVGWLARVA